ncbi:complement C3-like isoform X1 [Alosa pseudoharengus]|uniref:complement C3-like isoform X1 n=1 Tax=Alosa pseudoharengus TaxID=34774 RepID=UPI003F8BA584
MRVDLVVVCVAAVAFSLPALSTCKTVLFVLSAPNLLRVNTPEKVFVEAQDYTGADQNVKITVMNYPKKNVELASTTVTLNQANQYMVLADITIPNKEGTFDDDESLNQYVYLQAKFTGHLVEKVVLVSFQSGYIFVQTDKTIYTPSSTVMYRVFSLNPALHPVESGISVEIMTPDGITISKEVIYPKGGIKSGEHKLPELVSFGTWKVVTRFVATPQRNFTADFEVKEYVLPSFEVSLTPGKAFFYVDDQDMTVDIVARYLYGKEVTGVGFVAFGVSTNENEKRSLAASLQRVEIRDGKGKAVLTKEHITKTFPNINELVGSSLYVSVSVLTETGSEMVEAHKRGIPIVTSPYTIHFKRTPKYFKPGMPFDVSVLVTNPDNSPADKVDVEVTAAGQSVMSSTRSNGMAKATINTQGGASQLPIIVMTKAPGLKDAQQARADMRALPYVSKGGSKNYLHVGVDAAELTIGDQLKVNLNLGGSPGAQNNDFTYLILTKGQLVQAERFKRQGQNLVTLSLPVTKDMVPSFRIVAYYHVGSTEVVSDSVWVDVKDTCMGTLKVEPSRPVAVYSPRERFSLTITGDPGARVGLVAVDKGVYVLNNKHRLTQTKIWDVIEKYDTGCTAGSGKDSMGVFFDAGLVFQSSTAGGTESRQEPTCPKPAKRRRRAITIQDLHNSLTAKYTSTERECCVDGMKENILGFTCERRAEYITDGDKCVQAFLHCCKEMSSQKKESKDEQLILARSEADDDAYYTDSEDIVSRSQFPESWLWEDDEDLPECPASNKHCTTTSMTKKSFLKDSITSWQVTAISISKTHGICVADPYEMIVMKDFFIDLKLPYSAVRNEQIEIKAILYNYNDYEIKVRVELLETDDVCSVATKKGKHRTTIEMDGMTSRAIPFVIIPMQLGKHTIEVKAAVFDSILSDGVKKDLLVVSEGVRTEVPVKKVVLNPTEHGGEQKEEVQSQLPKKQVPGTPAHTYVSVQGEQISQTIEKAITGDSMGSLIVQPRGCGEQNMIYMTLPLIATHYLDTTNQWENVGLEKRDTAIKYINMGYQQELAFRKPDGAFAVWADKPGSAWLTAYVAKVFAMARDIISIEEKVICDALKWLVLNSQMPDGIFKETFQVYHAEMVGDVRGKDPDASMTAFVLIAMQEGRGLCIENVASLPGSMKRATDYLQGRLKTVTNPYAVAMVSYALANEGKLDQEILFKYSAGGTHWPVPGNHLFTLEATAYALLALVKANEFEKAAPIVKWLNEQQKIGGGYGSTQSTIMVFQAVAEYTAKVKQQDMNLVIDLKVSGRAKSTKWTFTKSNSFLTRSDKMNLNENLTVTASGTGEATLSVMTLYYAMPSDILTDCKMFDLEVKLEKQNRVTYQQASESYLLTIDVLYLSKERSTTMSILDIGLLTGFSVDESDLTQLSTGKDRYIQRFEMDKMLSDRGSLIIYLDKISHTRPDRIAFRIHKMMDVGLLQPAAVSVYEYLDMENRCTRFYHPIKKGGELNRICHKDICKCAEESCCAKKTDVSNDDRAEKACEPGMDYVYKVKVEKMDLTHHTDTYHMKVIQVIKEGTDFGVEGHTREFIAHPNCRDQVALQQGKSYLIMGHRDDVVQLDGSFRYMLGHATWLEYWPTEQEGQTPEYEDAFAGITGLAHEVMTFGCGI